MNIHSFKENVLSIKSLAIATMNMGERYYNDLLVEFIESIQYLVDFIEDDANLTVLNQYQKETEKQTPLDCLCVSIIHHLEDIDTILKCNLFERSNITENEPNIIRLSKPSELNQALIKLKGDLLHRLLSAFKVLRHLSGHNKTLIVIGPNGSGKTSFANHMRNLDTHVKVIPATKPIIVNGFMERLFRNTINNYNDELYKGGNLNQDMLLKLIIGICNEHDDVARKFMETKVKEKDTIYEKIKRIFDDFFEVKLDNTAFSQKEMQVKKDNGEPYSFNNMSDGERVAFFYIATVIAAPDQSFIIVDEPENHLNPAIYNKIWDRLIETRSDCQFIFISHTMEFISARTNYEIVKIKNFTYPDKFEFEFLGNALNDINIQYVIEMVGSRKPILFCEGTKSDYDYKIYESIFGDNYTVIPTGTCISVKNSVEACNMHATVYGVQNAIGIIDSDLKSPQETERLKNKKIYTLKCNEIEMLLVDEVVIKKALERVYKPEEICDSFKEAFFRKLGDRKQDVVKRLTKTYIDEKLRNTIIDDRNNRTKEEIKNNLAISFTELDVDKIWSDYEEKIDMILSQRNYDQALQYCCLEHGEVISGIGNRFIPDYPNIALGVVRNDDELKKHIKDKYLSDIWVSQS